MSNRLIACPHCGYDPSKLTDWNFSEWKITTEYGIVNLKSQLQASMFDLFWRKQGIKGLNRNRIIEIIYADDIDGGTEPANITHEIARIRKLVEIVGIHIRRGFTGGEGYSLMFTTPEQAKLLNTKQSNGQGSKGYSKPKVRKTDDLEPIWMTKRKLEA